MHFVWTAVYVHMQCIYNLLCSFLSISIVILGLGQFSCRFGKFALAGTLLLLLICCWLALINLVCCVLWAVCGVCESVSCSRMPAIHMHGIDRRCCNMVIYIYPHPSDIDTWMMNVDWMILEPQPKGLEEQFTTKYRRSTIPTQHIHIANIHAEMLECSWIYSQKCTYTQRRAHTSTEHRQSQINYIWSTNILISLPLLIFFGKHHCLAGRAGKMWCEPWSAESVQQNSDGVIMLNQIIRLLVLCRTSLRGSPIPPNVHFIAIHAMRVIHTII